MKMLQFLTLRPLSLQVFFKSDLVSFPAGLIAGHFSQNLRQFLLPGDEILSGKSPTLAA